LVHILIGIFSRMLWEKWFMRIQRPTVWYKYLLFEICTHTWLEMFVCWCAGVSSVSGKHIWFVFKFAGYPEKIMKWHKSAVVSGCSIVLCSKSVQFNQRTHRANKVTRDLNRKKERLWRSLVVSFVSIGSLCYIWLVLYYSFWGQSRTSSQQLLFDIHRHSLAFPSKGFERTWNEKEIGWHNKFFFKMMGHK
jgi:hypothetical protein